MRRRVSIAIGGAIMLAGAGALSGLVLAPGGGLGNIVGALGGAGGGGASGSGGGGAAGGGASGSSGGASGASGSSGGAGAGGGGASGSSGGAGAGGAGGGSGTCGNGTVESGESCDGSDLQNATCVTLGFSGGSLACSSSCGFDVSSCTGGTLTPSVSASRTSCKAPCGVYFDATATSGLSGSDYVGANWDWDFNDPSSPHKTTIGSFVGHVFDSPGTYHVTTRVHDLAGAAGSTTTTIAVSAMSGTTYYVASSGNNSNSGTSMGSPFLTIAHAVAVATTNDTILIRRGDTFPGLSTINLSTAGPIVIAAYTDPGHVSAAAPDLTTVSTSLFNPSANDIRIADLHIESTSDGIASIGATNTVFERIEGQGFTTVVFGIQQGALNSFVVDCNVHDFNAYLVYADRSSHVAVIGNSATTAFSNTSGEGLRMQGGSDSVGTSGQFTSYSYIAENAIQFADPAGSGFESYTFRGDNHDTVFVGNTANHYVSFAPQNASGAGSNEHVSLVLAEGNTWNNTGASGDLFDALVLTAQHVVIRNNLFETPIAGIVVTRDPSALLANTFVDLITIANNTMYTYPTVGSAPYLGFNIDFADTIGLHSPQGRVTISNNIMSEGVLSTSSTMVGTDSTGVVSFDHNLIYAPNATGSLSNPRVGTGGVNNSDPKFVAAGSDFRLQAGSPAIDVGANTHVYGSAGPSPPRPQNASWDMGRSERKNP